MPTVFWANSGQIRVSFGKFWAGKCRARDAKSRVEHAAETISDGRRCASVSREQGRSRSRAGGVQTLLTHHGRRLPTHPCTATQPGASMEWMIALLSLGMLFQFSMRVHQSGRQHAPGLHKS